MSLNGDCNGEVTPPDLDQEPLVSCCRHCKEAATKPYVEGAAAPRTTIVIGTSEGYVLQVPMYPLIKHSAVIRDLLYDYCKNSQRTDPVLRLKPEFDAATLTRVVEWCNHHGDVDLSQPFEDMCEWDLEFLKIDIKSLMDLVKASYYLEIDGLGDLSCHGLAQVMGGKNPEQLRDMFHRANLHGDDWYDQQSDCSTDAVAGDEASETP
ncbi:unnamed protein product [Notodromas monacha]|uniref:SKP1 component POZ domain-containing protein n=1 Tax=Notodromas monacha TaxID=399045 RepID=A0A7R9BQ47_9CRUS|nr:unnamed protein product [Notodromas monacha]CAG0919590.1 unnamed protein product [Notodromas monacha]